MKALRAFLCWALVLGSVAPALAEGEADAIREQSEALKAAFLRYYKPVAFDLKPNAPQLALPLDLKAIGNAALLDEHVGADAARRALEKNGFVVVEGPGTDLFHEAYAQLKHRQVPIVVTSDSVLHLYHVLFDNALMEIEEAYLFDDLKALLDGVLGATGKRLGIQGRQELFVEADTATLAYLGVAMRLLDPDYRPPKAVAEMVEAELKLIEAHAGPLMSPLFGYEEDYSQYVPRGHYTRSIKLKRYFMSMMWLGRMTFLLKGRTEEIHNALIDGPMADRQTVQALLLSQDLTGDKALLEHWQRIYTVTSFIVGLADDLTPQDYAEAHAAVRTESGTRDITAKPFLDGMRWFMAKQRSPLIYGGTGAVAVPGGVVTEAMLDDVLDQTKGLRLMGQRFVPDSFVMGRLVNLKYTGQGRPFTMADGIRVFPRGLDVMRLLGSARARAILDEEGDTAYAAYDERIADLEGIFAGFDTGDWHQNLYWGWLASLRTLLTPSADGALCGAGYPSFMQTEAYTDKALNATLASWSQLRHDTILYAKQSYTMEKSAVRPPATVTLGYVEPLPALYAELVAINTMTREGLKALGVLSDEMEARFQGADRVLRTLLDLSIKELESEALSDEDLRFIRDFGDRLSGVIGDLTDDSKRTTIIADVHSDLNTRLALEEATGPVDLMWVVWKTPNGQVVAGAGPVLSYYEFKHPMSDRLTDEAWRELVRKDAPMRAPWTKRFLSDVN